MENLRGGKTTRMIIWVKNMQYRDRILSILHHLNVNSKLGDISIVHVYVSGVFLCSKWRKLFVRCCLSLLPVPGKGRQTGRKDLMKKLKSESMQKYGGMYWEIEEVRINYYRSRVWLVCKNNNTTYEYTLLEQPTIAYFMYELVKLGGQILNAALEAGRDMFDGSIYTMADLFREKTFSVDGKTMRTGWQGQSSADRFLCQRLWCRWRNMDYGSYFTRKVPLQFASFSQRISL